MMRARRGVRWWAAVAVMVALLRVPAPAIQTFLQSDFSKNTETLQELTELQTMIVVASVAEFYFGLVNLVVQNTTPEHVQVFIVLRESLLAVPDETLSVTLQPNALNTIQLPKQYTGTGLGLGAHTFKVLVNQSSTGAIIYQTESYLGLFNNTGSGGGGAIISINGQNGAVQTFAFGTAGTDFAIVSAANVHTWNLPSASQTARGVVTIVAQEFEGVKTFDDGIISQCGNANIDTTCIGATVNGGADNCIAIGGGGVPGTLCLGISGIAIGVNAVSSSGGTSVGTSSGSLALGCNAYGIGATCLTANTFVSGSDSFPVNTVFFGKGESSATPTGYSIIGTDGSGSNITGGDITIGGGRNTGAGVGGSVNLAVSSTQPGAAVLGSRLTTWKVAGVGVANAIAPGDFIPNADQVYNIGSGTRRVQGVYATQVAGGTTASTSLLLTSSTHATKGPVSIFDSTKTFFDVDGASNHRLTLDGITRWGINTALGGVGEIVGNITPGTGAQLLVLNPSTETTVSSMATRAVVIDAVAMATPVTIQNGAFFGFFLPGNYTIAASASDVGFALTSANGIINVDDATFPTKTKLFQTSQTLTTSVTGTAHWIHESFVSYPFILGDGVDFTVVDYRHSMDEPTIRAQNGGSSLVDEYSALTSDPTFDGADAKIATRHGLFIKDPGISDINQFIGVDLDDQGVTYNAWSLFSHSAAAVLDQRGPATVGASPLVTSTLAAGATPADTTIELTSSNNFAASGVVRIEDRYYAYSANNTGVDVLTLDVPFRSTSGTVIAPGTPVTQYWTPIAQLNVFPDADGRVGVMVQGFAGQTAALTSWRDSTGAEVASVGPQGMSQFLFTRLLPTDFPPTCNAGAKGEFYYDDSLSEACDCDGAAWGQVDGGGGC